MESDYNVYKVDSLQQFLVCVHETSYTFLYIPASTFPFSLKDAGSVYEKDPTVLYSDIYTEIRLDDVFWILNFENACKMYTVFDYIKTNMTAEQDERHTILKFLKDNNIINSSTFRKHYQYAIYRNESYMFDPMNQFTECFRNDWLHYGSFGLTEEEYFNHILKENKLGRKYD